MTPASRTRKPRRNLLPALLSGALFACGTALASEGGLDREVRFATFNASLNRGSEGALAAELADSGSAQPAVIAEIIQRVRPDVLLINEFDYDAAGLAAQLFRSNYLGVSQSGQEPLDYPFYFVAPSNTGVPSGLDLDNDGNLDGDPDDAFGFGFFPGQYGMVVYSRYPIDRDKLRSFQHFLWQDMPGALLPDDPNTPQAQDWYSQEELQAVRLSSKSHWDVPVAINGRTVHLLASHPTPPVFDGPEDRNGKRNHDEIRFWADYLRPGPRSNYIYDDNGDYGGLRAGALFVLAGDMNADPYDGDSAADAANQLLRHPRINTRATPDSLGGPDASARQGENNLTHNGDPAYDTADFAEASFGGPGNLRVDYVLPSRSLRIVDAGVFWPEATDPLFAPLVGDYPFPSSDHRLVWIDIRVGAF
ncbi:endonuclease/exonuclease/phosphatase family protein [Mangrovimicrobium sediminis]|uniref:Endonuclease/exonuclease/phosphatase family protein n=1 Tax=Mangrovimicrobium sediminis TaxID=2562682 RepID=A0A4Z0M8X5_9GAMM|nr:endonuclease/exonuclease/phosphatase family protein [Haliea sp. SAOS-164]TGD75981.1 endonuclease/exonuclease/phosphatase family protein [Haliea sp. SAOS-164]